MTSEFPSREGGRRATGGEDFGIWICDFRFIPLSRGVRGATGGVMTFRPLTFLTIEFPSREGWRRATGCVMTFDL